MRQNQMTPFGGKPSATKAGMPMTALRPANSLTPSYSRLKGNSRTATAIQPCWRKLLATTCRDHKEPGRAALAEQNPRPSSRAHHLGAPHCSVCCC
eukprot:3680950-Heterocapsa_arctica.AAC.1